MNILVTGSNGQLGKCLKDTVYTRHVLNGTDNNYIFLDKNTFDITDRNSVINVLKALKIGIVVNCAAYTNVEDAETNEEAAYKVNSVGVDNLAYACYLNNAYMIHISTDFVFSGEKEIVEPYKEDDEPNPLNIYGKSKFDGEISALCYPNTIIIRTSWLYSEYGKNFYTTMKSKIDSQEHTKVVSDQFGTPTNAHDLADAIYEIIESNKYIEKNGIYHFSNTGTSTWYHFARKIEHIMFQYNLIPFTTYQTVFTACNSYEYPTKAVRPKYSSLDSTKFQNEFHIQLSNWEDSLEEFIKPEKFKRKT